MFIKGEERGNKQDASNTSNDTVIMTINIVRRYQLFSHLLLTASITNKVKGNKILGINIFLDFH